MTNYMLACQGRGLGWFSAQLGETLHSDLVKVLDRFGGPEIQNENYGQILRSAITVYNHEHITVDIPKFCVSEK